MRPDTLESGAGSRVVFFGRIVEGQWTGGVRFGRTAEPEARECAPEHLFSATRRFGQGVVEYDEFRHGIFSGEFHRTASGDIADDPAVWRFFEPYIFNAGN